MRALLVLPLLALLAAGCSDDRTPPTSCDEGFELHPSEERCAKATNPGTEVCNAYLQGSADEEVSCQVESDDGIAWLEWTSSSTGHTVVDVKDGAGASIFHEALEPGPDPGGLQGEPGTWTLSVNFQDASGSARIVLWG